MPKFPVVKARELARVVQRLGFYKFHQVGSHAQFKHPDGRRTTIPIHGSRDIKKKVMKSILDDIQISVEEFRKIL